jgi:glycosyltransferase involved in cell wall biosynthesis
VILESMACGCSIVATSVGAIPEMLNIDSDSPCGITVDKQNVIELKQAIEKMLTDESFAQKCKNNAVKKVFSEYSMDVVWGNLVKIWYDLSHN